MDPIGVFIYEPNLLRNSILCLNIVFKVVNSLKVGGMHHMKRNQPMMFAQLMTMSKKNVFLRSKRTSRTLSMKGMKDYVCVVFGVTLDQ
jgi:hypothetical protein